MTDPIHQQAELNKLNERHMLLEARLSHLRELLTERKDYQLPTEYRITHALDFLVSCTLAETFAALNRIRELEDALEETKARRQ